MNKEEFVLLLWQLKKKITFVRPLQKFMLQENQWMNSSARFIGAGTMTSWEWVIVTVVSLIELYPNKNRYRWQRHHLKVTDSTDLEPSVSDASSWASFTAAVTVMSLPCPTELCRNWRCLLAGGALVTARLELSSRVSSHRSNWNHRLPAYPSWPTKGRQGSSR